MSGNVSQLGVGDVVVTLNGTEYVLKPSLNALQVLSRKNGGIRGSIEAVMRMDIDVITTVIEVGLTRQAVKAIGNLPEAVYTAGLTDDTGAIVLKCIDFLSMLSHGGKPARTPSDDEDSTNTNPPKSV